MEQEKNSEIFSNNHNQQPAQFQNQKQTISMEESVANLSIKHEELRSANSGSMLSISQNKMPNSIRKTIKTYAKQNKEEVGKSKISIFLKTFVKQKKFNCEICQCEYQEKQRAKMCDCEHFYCQSCLQHYVIYKTGIFEDVVCPDQMCSKVINMNLLFFTRLPQEIQKRYKKIRLFQVTSQNPKLKLCPNEKCDEGVIEMKDGVDPKCQKCDKTFCKKCMFPKHQGNCDNNQVDFFQNNLHFRQCKKCKVIIELSKGCNHMTCKCGHQFCYLCGRDWEGNGHLCLEGMVNQMQVPRDDEGQIERPFECLNAIDTDTSCGTIIAILVKIFILFPLYLFQLIVQLCFLLAMAGLLFTVSVLYGVACYSFVLICDEPDVGYKLLMIILLPLTMIKAVYLNLRQFFLESYLEVLVGICTHMFVEAYCYFRW